MAPAEAVLENKEVFRAFQNASDRVLHISSCGEEPLLVIREAPLQEEIRLRPKQLSTMRSDFDDFQEGHRMPARAAIAQLRKRHAL